MIDRNILGEKIPPQDLFLLPGNMILEGVKYEQLNRIILKDTQLWKIFQFVTINNSKISNQSLQILNFVLTEHLKSISQEFSFIENNKTKFIQNMNKLIAHGSYAAKKNPSSYHNP